MWRGQQSPLGVYKGAGPFTSPICARGRFHQRPRCRAMEGLTRALCLESSSSLTSRDPASPLRREGRINPRTTAFTSMKLPFTKQVLSAILSSARFLFVSNYCHRGAQSSSHFACSSVSWNVVHVETVSYKATERNQMSQIEHTYSAQWRNDSSSDRWHIGRDRKRGFWPPPLQDFRSDVNL